MKKAFYTIFTFVIIIIIWYKLSLTVNPLFIPNPLVVFKDFKILISDGTIFIHLLYTFRRIMIATCLSGIIALPLGLLVRNSKIAKATIYPIIMLLRYIPVTAFYPLLIMWVGIGEEMKIAFLFIATFVYMLPSVVLALEEANADMVDSIFTDKYIQNIASEFSATEVSVDTEKTKVTEENKQEIADTEALLGGTASVTFIKNTAKFSDSEAASAELDKFIDIAKILDGAIIEIAGNTDPNPDSDPKDEYNIKLSKQRAEAVKQYFIMNGISADRIVTVGNGSSNPVVDNDTEEHRAMNRRTNVSFKIIESN